jgi:hypothetical protein
VTTRGNDALKLGPTVEELACKVASKRDLFLAIINSKHQPLALVCRSQYLCLLSTLKRLRVQPRSPHRTISNFSIHSAASKPAPSSHLQFMHWCACRLSRSPYETQRKPSNSPSLQFSDSRFPQGMCSTSSLDQPSLTASHLRAFPQDSHGHAAIGSVFDSYPRFIDGKMVFRGELGLGT